METYAAVALVVAGASVAMAVSGFGYALLSVPLLAVLVGAETSVVANAVIGLGLVTLMTIRNRHGVVRRTATVASAGAILAMPLGLVVFVNLDDRALTAAIGTTVIALTIALARGMRFPSTDRTDLVAGLISGALNTSTGTNGPPLVIALHGQRLDPVAFRATLAAIFLVQSVVGLSLFALAGRVTADVGAVALAGYPAMVVGLLMGERLATRVGTERFRGSVLGLLVVSGVVSLIAAALDA
ncbi:MAG: sulfite exporter TauE/SafE family protein [Actinomycetota bacterium]|nr:sulfite exporter TauE/SafE family protein [Actinomycetota bacterium]MDH5223675.1 sulfite exporter TauE/SafE family protein [Actinomycetota bacterium]MDH5313999.1 sulfite exporter TauE/SafE family protein [Actinomycetota bacterium]